jgi:hypothetical protein
MGTTLLYLLAAAWAVGTLGGVFMFLRDMCETAIGRVFGACIGVPIWAVLGLGPVALVQHESGPVLATLLKSEWRCTASHAETTTSFVKSGDVMVPITSTTNVCDAYGRS